MADNMFTATTDSASQAGAPLIWELEVHPQNVGRVHEQSSQTVLPINRAAEDLADDVIAGVKKISTILDKVALLFQMFNDGERDSNNRLKIPIKGCYSKQEFCNRHLDRNIRTIQKQLAAVLAPKEQKAAKESGAKSGLGSVPHVNESHPQHQGMKDKGLIKDDTEVRGSEEAEAHKQPADEKIRIQRKDGSLIEEATYGVNDAVRNNLIFIQSSYKFMNAEEKTQVIDKLIAKLLSERDFIMKETALCDTQAEQVKPESLKRPKDGTGPHERSVADAPATAAQHRKADLAVLREWASKYGGTAWHARKDCKGRLSSNKLDYINGLLNELADTGQIPYEDQGGRRMGQYTLLYSRPGRGAS